MEMWALIQKMMSEDWEFQSGKHTCGLKGYWACFMRNNSSKEKCEECGEQFTDWKRAGHSMVIEDAVQIAYEITQGNLAQECDMEDFV